MKEVMLVTGAGQISMAIARRVGYGKKIVLGDKNMDNCNTIAKIMNDAGFDVEPFEMDLSSRESILAMIAKAQEFGEIKYLVNGAGVSPSQAPIEAILKVDLYEENAVREIIKLKSTKLPPAAVKEYYDRYCNMLYEEYGTEPSKELKEMVRSL